MAPADGSDLKGAPIHTLKPASASAMQKWAEDRIDVQTVSGEVNGTHREPMLINFSDLCPNLNIPPYILDEVVTFWYELRVAMTHGKRMIIKKAISSPEDAPLYKDYTGTMSGLVSLIHLHDASYALDDDFLKRLTTAALRERLISMEYDMTEWIEAMDNAYHRKPNCEKNILLRKIIFSSAIFIHDRVIPNAIEGASFLHQQFWHPDFAHDFLQGIVWYYTHYLPSMRMRDRVRMDSEFLKGLKEM
ncbi:uncharacterized protein N0V89_012448 [Didymosphaeria variabile]|uniref:Uncharacterized protein n=1 Tax=Didymosphaeria variabile TaxID=1932322 RepID=A0A9W8X980_9PLEO|nr:uncharacterized protein N0V89_012448 [Didymosphaeria variabile]KAJ4344704.1 hypothetical protein N0V89_012448 [Didymosphaeria variabile]